MDHDHQAACRLIAFLGLRHTIGHGSIPKTFEDETYQKAFIDAAKITYDMDYPTEETMYGPYIQDEPGDFTPDWLQLASIRIMCEEALLEHSDELLHRLTELDRLRPGSWSAKAVDQSRLDTDSIDEEVSFNRDWAGVEGTWRSVRSFPLVYFY